MRKMFLLALAAAVAHTIRLIRWAGDRAFRDRLVAILREEIMAVISKHVQVDHDDVHIKMDRGERMSTLEIDIQIPNAKAKAA